MNRNKQESVVLSKDALADKKEVLRLELDDYSSRIEIVKKELALKEKQALELQDLNGELESTREKLHSLFKEESKFLAEFERAKKEHDSTIAILKEDVEDLIALEEKKKSELSAVIEKHNAELVAFEAKKAQAQANLKDVESTLTIQYSKLKELSQQEDIQVNVISFNEEEITRLRKELDELKPLHTELKEKLSEVEKELSKKIDALDAINRDIDAVSANLKVAEDKAQSIIDKANAHKDKVTAEIDAREGIVSLREGWIDRNHKVLTTAKKELEEVLGRPLTRINLDLDEIQ